MDDVLTIQGLIRAGLGIGMLSELALLGHRPPQLVHRPLADWPVRRTYALLWPGLAGVAAVSTVLAEIRGAVRSLPHP